jgi:Fe-S cluster assembly protein SufA
MKKYLLKSKKKNLKGIFITKSAFKKISEILEKNQKNIGIMIDIKKSGCAGFKYIIKNYKKKKNTEIQFSNHKISIFLPINKINLLDGITVDFITENFHKYFSFDHISSKKKCGCGVSFQIKQ